jgi:CRISPR/Cas system-associated exonuclease Cas4 (RecB family)
MTQQYSVSRILKYELCPRQYYARYVLGLEEPKVEPLDTGSAIHEWIEREVKKDHYNMDSDDVAPYFREYPLLDQAKFEHFRRAFRRQFHDLEEYYDLVGKPFLMDSWRKSFESELVLMDEEFKGIVDLVTREPWNDDSLTLVDFKTSRRELGTIHEDYEFQLMVYAWKYEELYGERPKWVVVWYLADGVRHYFKVTDESIQRAKERFISVVHKIENSKGIEDFPCSKHNFCKYGAFADLCG